MRSDNTVMKVLFQYPLLPLPCYSAGIFLRCMKRILLFLCLFCAACSGAQTSTTQTYPEWTAEVYPAMDLSIQHPVEWTVKNENGKDVFRTPSDSGTTITLYKGKTLREEVRERKMGDEFLGAEVRRIDGGFVTIITYSNESVSRYRDYLFHRFQEDDSNVIVAEMIATVPNGSEGIPDFTLTTEAEKVLDTVRLLTPAK